MTARKCFKQLTRKITPRKLNVIEERQLNRWHLQNVNRLAFLDQQIIAAGCTESAVFAVFLPSKI